MLLVFKIPWRLSEHKQHSGEVFQCLNLVCIPRLTSTHTRMHVDTHKYISNAAQMSASC